MRGIADNLIKNAKSCKNLTQQLSYANVSAVNLNPECKQLIHTQSLDTVIVLNHFILLNG